jgi:hypothetical protein
MVPKIRHPSLGIGNLLKICVSGDLASIKDISLIFISLNLYIEKESQKICFVNFKNEI